MGNHPSIDVWFGVSSRGDDDLVDLLCKRAREKDLSEMEIGGFEVMTVYNSWIDSYVGWG